MNFNFKAFILQKLHDIQNDLAVSEYNFYCEYEQDYIKMPKGQIDENGIYIVIKNLTSSIELYAETQPCQIIVTGANDEIEKTQLLLRMFAQTYNFHVVTTIKDNKAELVKMQFSDPVVLSNFNPVAYGYRSVLYISCTLYITEDVYDIGTLTIDSEVVKPLTFTLNYAMTPNSQQIGKYTDEDHVVHDEELAISVKSTSSLSIALSVPLLDSTFIDNILKIMDGKEKGNKNFAFVFTIGEQTFTHNMKLTSAQFMTAPNNIPSLSLGFIR